jgi:hypothetical protein
MLEEDVGRESRLHGFLLRYSSGSVEAVEGSYLAACDMYISHSSQGAKDGAPELKGCG